LETEKSTKIENLEKFKENLQTNLDASLRKQDLLEIRLEEATMDVTILRERNVALEKKVVDLQTVPFHVHSQQTLQQVADNYGVDGDFAVGSGGRGAGIESSRLAQHAYDHMRKRSISAVLDTDAGAGGNTSNAAEMQGLKDKVEELTHMLRERTSQLKILMDSLEVLQSSGSHSSPSHPSIEHSSSSAGASLDNEADNLNARFMGRGLSVNTETSWTTQSLVKRYTVTLQIQTICTALISCLCFQSC
jgi:hypothetical protein